MSWAASPRRASSSCTATTSASTARATRKGSEADSIGFDTRILTVCDVYDALVSNRVYRDAWSHDAAIALLHEQVGTAFDERCVAALEVVLGRDAPQRALASLRVAAASA